MLGKGWLEELLEDFSGLLIFAPFQPLPGFPFANHFFSGILISLYSANGLVTRLASENEVDISITDVDYMALWRWHSMYLHAQISMHVFVFDTGRPGSIQDILLTFYDAKHVLQCPELKHIVRPYPVADGTHLVIHNFGSNCANCGGHITSPL